jgi:hypothetical protein
MSYTRCDSEHALASAIMAELDRRDETPLHGAIRLSYSTAFLANGIKRCSVQVECKAGCGYLIQAVGEEADMLQEKAMAIQSLLREGIQKTSISLFEDLFLVLPGFMSDSRPSMPKWAKELTL